jgi:branched-chain amino acid transport system substrate-binding protein
MKIVSALKLLIGVLCFSFVLSGCGVATQSSKSSDNSSAGGQTVKEIKIGAPYPITGAWAENGQNNVNGMLLAADQINKDGGIKALGGVKIKIITADTGSDNPSNAMTVTSKLINDDKVNALVGDYVSSMSLPGSTAAEQGKVPMITQSYSDQLTSRGYKYLFQLPPTATALGSVAIKDYLDITKSQGKTVKSIGIIGSNDASAKNQSEALKNQSESLGLKVAPYVTYPTDLSDASSIINKIKQSNPDVISVEGPLPGLTLIIKAIRESGITTPIIGPSGGGFLAAGFPKILGKYAEGTMSVSAWNDDMNLDGIKTVAEAYDKKYGTAFMPQEAGESYVAVYIIAAAIEKAKSADPKKIRDAIASLNLTSGTASAMPPGKIEFNDNGLNKDAESIVIQWQNGVPRTVWPKNVATAEIK